jgi:hypothetical protein
MTRCSQVSLLVAFAATSLAGCSRDHDAVVLTAPFNEETKLGALTAVWKPTGQERSFADASRLKEPEVELRYRVDARNDMKDPIYIRLGGFELLSKEGLAIAKDDRRVECTVPPGRTEGALSGSIWVAKKSVDQAARFNVARFSAPLSERGRSLYREWLLQARPGDEKAIDAELGAYASAPACTALPAGS